MRGSCLCGQVGYEVDALCSRIQHCSCRTCRKAHAAAFNTAAQVKLRAATLDEDPGQVPALHIWASHEVPWLQHRAQVPVYPEWEPDADEPGG